MCNTSVIRPFLGEFIYPALRTSCVSFHKWNETVWCDMTREKKKNLADAVEKHWREKEGIVETPDKKRNIYWKERFVIRLESILRFTRTLAFVVWCVDVESLFQFVIASENSLEFDYVANVTFHKGCVARQLICNLSLFIFSHTVSTFFSSRPRKPLSFSIDQRTVWFFFLF